MAEENEELNALKQARPSVICVQGSMMGGDDDDDDDDDDEEEEEDRNDDGIKQADRHGDLSTPNADASKQLFADIATILADTEDGEIEFGEGADLVAVQRARGEAAAASAAVMHAEIEATRVARKHQDELDRQEQRQQQQQHLSQALPPPPPPAKDKLTEAGEEAVGEEPFSDISGMSEEATAAAAIIPPEESKGRSKQKTGRSLIDAMQEAVEEVEMMTSSGSQPPMLPPPPPPHSAISKPIGTKHAASGKSSSGNSSRNGKGSMKANSSGGGSAGGGGGGGGAGTIGGDDDGDPFGISYQPVQRQQRKETYVMPTGPAIEDERDFEEDLKSSDIAAVRGSAILSGMSVATAGAEEEFDYTEDDVGGPASPVTGGELRKAAEEAKQRELVRAKAEEERLKKELQDEQRQLELLAMAAAATAGGEAGGSLTHKDEVEGLTDVEGEKVDKGHVRVGSGGGGGGGGGDVIVKTMPDALHEVAMMYRKGLGDIEVASAAKRLQQQQSASQLQQQQQQHASDGTSGGGGGSALNTASAMVGLGSLSAVPPPPPSSSSSSSSAAAAAAASVGLGAVAVKGAIDVITEEDEEEYAIEAEEEDRQVELQAQQREEIQSASEKERLALAQEWDSLSAFRSGGGGGGGSGGDGDEGGGGGGVPCAKVSYAEVLKYLRSTDLSCFRNVITSAELKKSMLGRVPSLKMADADTKRDEVFLIAQVHYQPKVEIHRRLLQTIYRRLTGNDQDFPNLGGHWEVIGFQGNDPRTDLNRSQGIFSLVQLLYMLEKEPVFSSRLFQLASSVPNDWPFACVSIGFSKEAVGCLRRGAIYTECNKAGQVMSVVHEVHQAQFFDFFRRVHREPTTHHAIHLANVRQSVLKQPVKMLLEYRKFLQGQSQTAAAAVTGSKRSKGGGCGGSGGGGSGAEAGGLEFGGVGEYGDDDTGDDAGDS